MINYNNFYYIFPPRPKNAIPPSELNEWDDNSMIGQLKFNGSNAVIFMNGKDVFVFNRHGDRLTNIDLDKDEISKLYSGSGWMVINGEYLNKSKKDENSLTFNHKLIIFDILVYNSEYLLGNTFIQRIELLDKLFNKNESEKEYLFKVSENIYRVKSFLTGFKDMFDGYTKIDMIEGIVLKRKNSKLELGNTTDNNFKGQIKSRKKTKNYKF